MSAGHMIRTWTFQPQHATRDMGDDDGDTCKVWVPGPTSRSVDELSNGKAAPFAASSGDCLADYSGST